MNTKSRWQFFWGAFFSPSLVFLLWLALVRGSIEAVAILVGLGVILLVILGAVICIAAQNMVSKMASSGFRDNAHENLEMIRMFMGQRIEGRDVERKPSSLVVSRDALDSLEWDN